MCNSNIHGSTMLRLFFQYSSFCVFQEELLEESKRKFEEATGKLDTVHQSEMEELRKELDKKYQGESFLHNIQLFTL